MESRFKKKKKFLSFISYQKQKKKMSSAAPATSTTSATRQPRIAVKKRTIVKKKNDDDNKQPAEETTTTNNAAATENMVEVDDEEDEREKKIEQRLDETIEELKDYKAMTRGLCNDLIERLFDAKREIRQLRKNQKKQRVKKDPKKPNVFETDISISNQLCDFFEIPHGSKMSRNEVTHKLHKFCDDNNLMQKDNRRIIIVNDKLRPLLRNYTPGEQITWLNIQSYIKHHYI